MNDHLMKYIFILSFLFFCNSGLDLKAQSKVDSVVLKAPSDWRSELIPFPLGFAPDIDLKGFEDIRFAPGWADSKQADFWTYAFIWSLEENPGLSGEKLARIFRQYFDGLMKVVAEGNNIDKKDIPKTKAEFKVIPEKTNTPRYLGQIETFDAFFSKSALLLYVKAQYVFCEKTARHYVFFYLSPNDFDQEIWAEFNKVKMNVPCH